MTLVGPVWIVGSRGLLGAAVARRLVGSGTTVLTSHVPWSDSDAAVAELTVGFARICAAAEGGPWNLAWCAGSGVTSSSHDALSAEVDTVRRFVDVLLASESVALREGAVFMASSAGGIYAGAPEPPFTELTEPAPLAAYGVAKLATEREFTRLASESGARVLVGRISNLYGPGQDLSKPQGLISQICRSQRLAQPIGVYVSLDTVRDYLFVDDAAALVQDGLVMLRRRARPGQTVTKILAAQRSSSIAAVLGEFRRIFKRKPLLRLAASPRARQQARDLRFRSVVWPELDVRSLTPLPAGILATANDVTRRIDAGELSGLRRRD